MVEQHRRRTPPVGGSPSGPSNATLLIASVLLVALLSFALGYLTRGSSEEEVADTTPEAKVVDTTATPLDSKKILASTGVTDPTPTPTPQFLFTQTLTEETPDQAAVPRSDAPPAPPAPVTVVTATPEPTAKPTARPTSKPTVKPTPKPTPRPTVAPTKPVAEKETPGTFYSVQIAAVGDRNEATRLRIQLGNKGYRAYVIPFMKEGLTYYRVRVGPFKTRGAAEREQNNLQTKAGYKNTIISADER